MRVYNKRTTALLLMLLLLFVSSAALAQLKEETPENSIKIGLLLTDNNAIEAHFAAQLAIDEANEIGGIMGRPLQLVTRSMEGPWGTGSKEVVDLVFNENVWAILGSHDSRNAHVTEQVISKTRIVFLSAWASDATLSQAYVPWFFSCVPNDDQQAKALINEIYQKRKMIKTVVVLDNENDSKLAWESLIKEVKRTNNKEPAHFFMDGSKENNEFVANKIKQEAIEGIISLGRATISWNFIEYLRQHQMEQEVFTSLPFLEKGMGKTQIDHFDKLVVLSSGNWFANDALFYRNRFQSEFGKTPGAVAVYAYDGLNVIIEALKASNLDREKVRDAMTKLIYQGLTGSIQFDENGKRVDAVQLTEIKSGKLVPLQK